MSVCLQMGAKVNLTFTANGVGSYNTFSWFCKCYNNDWERDAHPPNCMILLLSVGADPLDAEVPQELRPQIQLWISGLEAAKQCLAAIFDNAMLEKEIADFVFNETFLRKALNQCK